MVCPFVVSVIECANKINNIGDCTEYDFDQNLTTIISKQEGLLINKNSLHNVFV